MVDRIQKIYDQSRGIYGSPRVHQTLQQQGYRISKGRVERLMQRHQLQGRAVKVTRRMPGLKRVKADGKNLRLDHPKATSINQIWVADITYLKVKQKWLYLSVVMDIYSRRILGWSLSKTRTTDLTMTTLRHAMKSRDRNQSIIFHTDRGIEYTAYRYQDYLKQHQMKSSLNRPGCCTDNAHMESFFHSLKTELIRGREFQSESELRFALNSYINQFYNHKRLHSGIGYQPPALYERMIA